MIYIMGNLFEETAGAEIHLAFGALPADPADFSDGAIGASTRHVRVLHSRHRIVHNLSKKKSLLIKFTSIITALNNSLLGRKIQLGRLCIVP